MNYAVIGQQDNPVEGLVSASSLLREDPTRLTSAQRLDNSIGESLGQFGLSRTAALAQALGIGGAERSAAMSLFGVASETWSDCLLGVRPPFTNDITDDGTPFEFSVGFEREEPEFRLLFESNVVGARPSARSSWDAGVALQRKLQQRGVVDTARFDRIAPLFIPREGQPPARFSLWHAAAPRPGASTLFKAYVNPEIMGTERAPTLVADALGRLNLLSAWLFIQQRLQHKVSIPYFSVDLDGSPQARAKVYLAATHADSVEELLRGCANSRPGDARAWLRQLLNGFEGPYDQRPILVCFAFTGEAEKPVATLHVPVRSYLNNDQEALDRALPLLPENSGEKLAAAMSSVTAAPLSESRGVLTYVSLRPVDGRVRVTTYLAPCAYSGAGSV